MLSESLYGELETKISFAAFELKSDVKLGCILAPILIRISSVVLCHAFHDAIKMGLIRKIAFIRGPLSILFIPHSLECCSSFINNFVFFLAELKLV